MYAPNAPDPRPSNAADYGADDLIDVIASHRTPGEQATIIAGAFLDYARWLTDWSPPEFQETEASAKPRGVPRQGTKEWRRWLRHKESLR